MLSQILNSFSSKLPSLILLGEYTTEYTTFSKHHHHHLLYMPLKTVNNLTCNWARSGGSPQSRHLAGVGDRVQGHPPLHRVSRGKPELTQDWKKSAMKFSNYLPSSRLSEEKPAMLYFPCFHLKTKPSCLFCNFVLNH